MPNVISARSTSSLFWGIGGATSSCAGFVNNAGVLEARAGADGSGALVVVRGAAPVGVSDLATKSYADSTIQAIRQTLPFY